MKSSQVRSDWETAHVESSNKLTERFIVDGSEPTPSSRNACARPRQSGGGGLLPVEWEVRTPASRSGYRQPRREGSRNRWSHRSRRHEWPSLVRPKDADPQIPNEPRTDRQP